MDVFLLHNYNDAFIHAELLDFILYLLKCNTLDIRWCWWACLESTWGHYVGVGEV